MNVYLWSRADRSAIDAPDGPAAPPVTARDHVRGPADAPVTVIVYSDFECPFCRELHVSLKQLGGAEKFRWVMRHFPVPSHQNAVRYAEACECAGRQGRFWEFADWVFDALTPRPAREAGPLPPGAAIPLTRPGPLTVDALGAAAGTMGADTEQFRSCLEGERERSRVESQKTEGDSIGIDGTPTFFVDGRRVVGMRTLDELRQMLRGRSL